MKFVDLETGGILYYAEIKGTELVDGIIKTKEIDAVKKYYANKCIEFKLSDGTCIIPRQDECYFIKNATSLQRINRPMNFTIYACSHDVCLAVLTRLTETKFKEINDEFKYINIQMSKVCLLNSVVRHLNDEEKKNKKLVLETVYAE